MEIPEKSSFSIQIFIALIVGQNYLALKNFQNITFTNTMFIKK